MNLVWRHQEEDLLDDSGKDQRQQSEDEGDEEAVSGTEQDSQASDDEDQEPGNTLDWAQRHS